MAVGKAKCRGVASRLGPIYRHALTASLLPTPCTVFHIGLYLYVSQPYTIVHCIWVQGDQKSSIAITLVLYTLFTFFFLLFFNCDYRFEVNQSDTSRINNSRDHDSMEIYKRVLSPARD